MTPARSHSSRDLPASVGIQYASTYPLGPTDLLRTPGILPPWPSTPYAWQHADLGLAPGDQGPQLADFLPKMSAPGLLLKAFGLSLGVHFIVRRTLNKQSLVEVVFASGLVATVVAASYLDHYRKARRLLLFAVKDQ